MSNTSTSTTPPASSASRDDDVTTIRVVPRNCLACGQPLGQTRGRQAYCDQACRQAAYRTRHEQPTAAALRPSRPPSTARRATTIYACPECDTLYLGQQRCEDCNTFCTRIGTGGTCPHCDEPITLDELLDITAGL